MNNDRRTMLDNTARTLLGIAILALPCATAAYLGASRGITSHLAHNRSTEQEKNPPAEPAEFIPVYGPDSRAEQITKQFYLKISPDLPLKDKLSALCSALSRFHFNGNPVHLREIRTVDDRKVAIVNLQDNDATQRNWRSSYFQGSTGARVTEHTLVKTLTRPDYTGSWVDGVKFLHDGKTIPPLDHIDLSGICTGQLQ